MRKFHHMKIYFMIFYMKINYKSGYNFRNFIDLNTIKAVMIYNKRTKEFISFDFTAAA